jgi:hypothetical protein
MPGKFFLYKYEVGDVVRMKKKHPCGSFEWTLTRVGAECKMTCNTCGRLAVMDRPTLEKSTVEVKRKSDDL